jgi:hypothetical protein
MNILKGRMCPSTQTISENCPVDMSAAETKLIETMKTDMPLSCIKAIEDVKAQLLQEQKKKFKGNLRRHGRWMHEMERERSFREDYFLWA